MKVVLTALDSKFIHSNLAVRYLKAYTRELNYECVIKEFTVNDRLEKLLEEIIAEHPDVLAFSCYIWNIQMVKALARLVKLVNPKIEILYGGPEVSYDSESFLSDNPGEYVICGEGEETYYEFINWQLWKRENKISIEEASNKLVNIKGLSFKIDDKIKFNGDRPLMDMNKIVFPYTLEDNLENRIVYYEASRGCPFKCKYCLSSTIHNVRFLDVDRVKEELKFLIDKGVKLIKFVDRTFNCNAKFATEIWEFLISLNTEATFHFEISADILTEKQIELLAASPKGRIQFEVGVQTTNNEVLRNIDRHVNFEDIKEKVCELETIRNVKQHLDLIAGLPGEDFYSFKKSFNDVYSIYPEEIQLGFLKLLKGSKMRAEAKKWEMVYSPYPPYEILRTKDISYEELLILKKVEEMVDKYYNSRKFNSILSYFTPKFDSPFDFYQLLGEFFYKKGYLNRNISAADYYRVFIEFNQEKFNKNTDNLREIIKYDFLKFNKKKWIPEFLRRERNKEEERKIKELVENGELKVSDNYHAEKFFIDLELFIQSGDLKETECYVIFDSENKNEFKQITI